MARYEDLRRHARGARGAGDRGLGLDLFLRQGMSAWMQAWVELAPRAAASAPARSTGEPAPRGTGPLPTAVATLLASLALARLTEGTR